MFVKKRQIYREQVLPHAGGKIPDSAFESDRLFLNRLQKEGIAIPDGVILESRNPQVFPYHQKSSRAVFKVAQSSDGRYIPVEGRYLYSEDSLPSVDTTYLYPQIHDAPHRQPPEKPEFLKYRQIEFYNSLLNQPIFHPKEKSAFVYIKPPYRYLQPAFNNLQYQYFSHHEGNVRKGYVLCNHTKFSLSACLCTDKIFKEPIERVS